MYNPFIYNDEIYKDIAHPIIKPIYSISNYGNIVNKFTGLLLSQTLTKDGYLRIGLQCIDGTCREFLVHRLVMMTFHPIDNPDSMEVNHIYGIKTDNHDLNLEWVTTMENNHHAFNTGLNNNIREQHSHAKLSNDNVIEICKMLSNGYQIRDIYNIMKDKTNCNDLIRNIRSIRDRDSWVSISKDYIFPESINLRNKFTDEQVELVCQYIIAGCGYKDILVQLGYDITCMSKDELNNYCDIINSIKQGNRYLKISSKYDFSSIDTKRYDQIFSFEDIKRICLLLEQGYKARDILARFNIFKSDDANKYEKCRHFVSRLKCRKVFKEISKDYKF